MTLANRASVARRAGWAFAAALLMTGAGLALRSQQIFDERSAEVEDYDNMDDGGMMSAKELRRMTTLYRVSYGHIASELRPWRVGAVGSTGLGLILTVLFTTLEVRRARAKRCATVPALAPVLAGAS
jgi:hypothetical protein